MKLILVFLMFANSTGYAKTNQSDSILTTEYFAAVNTIPNVGNYIDIVFNDLSETEKNEVKEFLKLKKIKLSQKMPAFVINDKNIVVGGKKISADFSNMTFKINGYTYAYDEKKSIHQTLEKLTKYFDGSIGASIFINRAFAEESATSYAAHGLENSALLAVGSYGAIKIASAAKNGKNIVNWNNGSGFLFAVGTVLGAGVGYWGAIASSVAWAGQSLTLLLANGKAKFVCENGKIFIKIDGKLISPDQLQSQSVESAKTLEFLAKTYTCTKTMTEQAATKIVSIAKNLNGQVANSKAPSTNPNAVKTNN